MNMNTHADKTQENKSQSVSESLSQKQGSGGSTFQFVDNRPEAIQMRKLQKMANNHLRKNSFKLVNNRNEVTQMMMKNTLCRLSWSLMSRPIASGTPGRHFYFKLSYGDKEETYGFDQTGIKPETKGGGEVIATGEDEEKLKEAIESLKDSKQWEGESYSIFWHNCQHFAQEALKKAGEIEAAEKARAQSNCSVM